MAGRPRKAGSSSLIPAQARAEDLTAARGLEALSGERVVDLARKTLDASERLIETWTDLEPLMKLLIKKFRVHAEADTTETVTATKLLGEAARASSAIAGAATNVMRASEGQVRLAILLAGPMPQRAHPGQLTEKQLVAVVLETARRVKAEQGTCPLCTTTTVSAAVPTTNGAAPPEG